MQLQRVRGHGKLHKIVRVLWRRGAAEKRRERVSLRKVVGKMIQMMCSEIRFWSD